MPEGVQDHPGGPEEVQVGRALLWVLCQLQSSATKESQPRDQAVVHRPPCEGPGAVQATQLEYENAHIKHCAFGWVMSDISVILSFG